MTQQQQQERLNAPRWNLQFLSEEANPPHYFSRQQPQQLHRLNNARMAHSMSPMPVSSNPNQLSSLPHFSQVQALPVFRSSSAASDIVVSSSTSTTSAVKSYPDNSDIYESLYDSRWRLMQKEAQRLNRESSGTPQHDGRSQTLPRPQQQQQQQQQQQPQPNSSSSSRDSSLGPHQHNSMQPALILSSKSPRSLLIQKRLGQGKEEGRGFGFTLRHFVVYPPEDDLKQYQENYSWFTEPMDTIFVKSVKEGGAAYEAGLRIGDRIVNVNGESVMGQSYSRVVQLIKFSGDKMSLIVVPQEDDILQSFFSEIAQNPETNQRPTQQQVHQQQKMMRPEEHLYAVPAHVQQQQIRNSQQQDAIDPSLINRIKRETNLKEEFLKRPHPQPIQVILVNPNPSTSVVTTADPVEYAKPIIPARKASDILPPLPLQQPQEGVKSLEESRKSGNTVQSRRSSAIKNEADEKSAKISSNSSSSRSSPLNSNNSRILQTQLQKEVTRRRQNNSQLTREETEERNLRRISYLKATKDDRVPIGTTDEFLDNMEHDGTTCKKVNHKQTPASIQKMRSMFGDVQTNSNSEQISKKFPKFEVENDDNDGNFVSSNVDVAISSSDLSGVPPQIGSSSENVSSEIRSQDWIKEGWLTCKVTAVEGKKATDRSWRQVYAVLKNHAMFMYRDKKMAHEYPTNCEEPPIHLSEIQVEVADDYTKRKSVFRVRTDSGSEYLFQCNEGDLIMHEWVQAIEETTQAIVLVTGQDNQHSRERKDSGGKSLKKLTSFRNRSPSAYSPATKTRKASQDQGFPSKDLKDKKTWKGKVAKQWKKMHHTGSHHSAIPGMSVYPEGASIGVLLEDCPMTEDNSELSRVPLIVTTCCNIVESRGLEIVGVYRVPGNSAAVNNLTELVNTNKGNPESFLPETDPRWNDVNVVSSLLKSFFRKLPEPLFTCYLYPQFIEACKDEDSDMRMNTLKKLVNELPEYNYETLKYVCRHLCQVISHSKVNKMDIQNMAIVFGPTLVRASDDNVAAMVTDMGQQCRIIESMLSNYDWFFDGREVSEIACKAPGRSKKINANYENALAISQTSREMLLLNNLQKLEEQGKMNLGSPAREVSAKDIMSGIISAANRKIQRSGGTPPISSIAAAAAAANKNLNMKRESMDLQGLELSASASRIQRLDTPTRYDSHNSSRRNSESVMQSAMAIAAAVPQLMGGNSAHSSTSSIPSAMVSNGSTSIKRQQHIINRIVNPYLDGVEKENNDQNKSSPFPIDTYTGLEEATAKRIKQFEEETRAMLARNKEEDQHFCQSSSTPSLNWKSHSELEGGILVEEPYQTSAYTNSYSSNSNNNNDKKDKSESNDKQNEHSKAFLNRTYLASGNNTNKSNPDTKLVRGISLSNIKEDNESKPIENLDKLRLQLKKSNTEPKLCAHLEEAEEEKDNYLHQQKPEQCDDLISSITATFDEKLRVLLDPNYQTATNVNSENKASNVSPALSVHSIPSKVHVPRHLIRDNIENDSLIQQVENSNNSPERSNVVSVLHSPLSPVARVLLTDDDDDSTAKENCPKSRPPPPRKLFTNYQKVVSSNDNNPILSRIPVPRILLRENFSNENDLTTNKPVNRDSPPRKTDLKRGRFVDKNKEPPQQFRQQNLKRNDSLTKRDKQNLNLKKKLEKEGEEFNIKKSNKDSKNRKRIRRRHTVGGTKDFGTHLEEKIISTYKCKNRERKEEDEEDGYDSSSGSSSSSSATIAWSRLQPETSNEQKLTQRVIIKNNNEKNMKESRRFSLPEAAMKSDTNTSNGNALQMPSLLESQV